MKFLGEQLEYCGFAAMSMAVGNIGLAILWGIHGVPRDPAFSLGVIGGFVATISMVTIALAAVCQWRASK